MESLIAQLFLALQARITAMPPVGDSTFRFVDHDYGQWQDEVPALSYPAVLLDFTTVTWQQLGNNARMGTQTVICKLVFAPYSGTNNLAVPEFKEKGLGFYELEDALVKWLDDWCPDDTGNAFGHLQYETASSDLRRTDLRMRDLAFTIVLDDYGNVPETEKIPVTFVINPHLSTETE
ncbi:MAG: hypothetical protein EBZ77_02575 [Chitinophagia bacterium]|nr:hypothetical protein [Chitinophagia bacterium]